MRSLKVLVLEDSPFQLMAIHQMLNASGVFDVLTAETVAEALASLAHRRAVDIVICDLALGEGDGLELIEQLVEQRLAHALIILSATERERLDEAARFARHNGLPVLAALAKPASSSVLHCLLQAYLDTSRSQLPTLTVEELGQEYAWQFPAHPAHGR